jgi:hypothetical protein
MNILEIIQSLKEWMPSFFGVVSSSEFLSQSKFTIDQLRKNDRSSDAVLDRNLLIAILCFEMKSEDVASYINRDRTTCRASIIYLYRLSEYGNYIKCRIQTHFEDYDNSINNFRSETPLALLRLQSNFNGKQIKTVKYLE